MPCTSTHCRSRRQLNPQSSTYRHRENCLVLWGHLGSQNAVVPNRAANVDAIEIGASSAAAQAALEVVSQARDGLPQAAPGWKSSSTANVETRQCVAAIVKWAAPDAKPAMLDV